MPSMRRLLLAILLLAATRVHAQDQAARILVGPGLMHLREPPRFGYASVEGNWMRPNGWLGAWASLDGTSQDNFIGIGPLVQTTLGRGWTLLAGTGPGVCSEDATQRLGYRFEFRTSAYLCWASDRGRGFAVSVSHYSNGGMSRPNPGVEGIRVLYAIRLGGGR
jgi:hypothetical protein